MGETTPGTGNLTTADTRPDVSGRVSRFTMNQHLPTNRAETVFEDFKLPLLRDAQSLKPRDDVARYIEQVERASKSKR